MNDESNQAPDRDVGKRIASQVQSIGRTPKEQVAEEELQKLKAAADRLDQMLKTAADADLEALRNAADRLDRLLKDIRRGKDVTNRLKLSRVRQEQRDSF
jgi:cell division protein ZapA (FtsZ GTPase activity inhibitor)